MIIYANADNTTSVEVRMDRDTVWLSLNQMAALFDRHKSVISRHLKNVFSTGELERDSVVAIFATTASDGKTYETEHFNLDAILSVGYRVNSASGTRFRQWATRRLHEHLVQGYSLNQRRLQEYREGLLHLKRALDLAQSARESKELKANEVNGLLDIIARYADALTTLDRFDRRELENSGLTAEITFVIALEEARGVISELRKNLKATALFGSERDESFGSILRLIVQTWDGKYLYNSIEEQAAHLLYFVIKNLPFTDGNKRIGAFLFVWFLDRNRHRLDPDGQPKINANGLAALALLVAQSDPAHKEDIIRLIINLVKNPNGISRETRPGA
jgi:prophage maintenance system killer protein